MFKKYKTLFIILIVALLVGLGDHWSTNSLILIGVAAAMAVVTVVQSLTGRGKGTEDGQNGIEK